MYYFKCEQNLLTNGIWTYIITTPMGESVRDFYKGVYFRCWFWLKRRSSHSNWPAVCTFVFLQNLLARRLITELISSCVNCFKLLNQNFLWVLKLPLTALGCYNTNVRLFTYLNNKLFSHELKILNYDGIWENKKLPDENQRFDWIKSVHGYRLVNIGWLADINFFDSMIWLF